MRRSNKKGFTLVELLVVIAIIAIIAAVAVPVTISQIDKAKISTAVSEANNGISAIQNAAGSIGATGTFNAGTLCKELNASFADPKQITSIIVTEGSGSITIEVITGTKISEAKDGYIKNGDFLAVKATLAGITYEANQDNSKVDGVGGGSVGNHTKSTFTWHSEATPAAWQVQGA